MINTSFLVKKGKIVNLTAILTAKCRRLFCRQQLSSTGHQHSGSPVIKKRKRNIRLNLDQLLQLPIQSLQESSTIQETIGGKLKQEGCSQKRGIQWLLLVHMAIDHVNLESLVSLKKEKDPSNLFYSEPSSSSSLAEEL